MHHDAADVAKPFAETADHEGDCEGAQAGADAEVELDQRAEEEEGAENGVGGDVGEVAVDCLGEGTLGGEGGALVVF